MFTTFLWLNVTLSCFKQLPLNSTLVLVPSQSAIIGPQDISRTSSSNIHRRSPKGPTWPSRGHPDLTSRERPNLTFWVRPNLTFKGRPWEVDLGRPLEDLQSAQTWMFQHFLWLFFQNLFDWPNLSKSISTLKVLWEPSETSKMEHFLQH